MAKSNESSKAAPKSAPKAAPKAGTKAPDKKAEKAAAKASRGTKMEVGSTSNATRSRLQDVFKDQIAPELMKKFGYKSLMQVPRLQKITLNMGVSEAVADKKVMDSAVADLTKIAGQRPVITKSRKAIANFKIRDNVPIGTMVTLRGVRMFEFLDRFVTVALPRVRDFRGISGRSFDGRGNYNVGVKEQIIFPEIEYDKIDAIRGLNISITTSAKTDEECRALLQAFRFPFKN